LPGDWRAFAMKLGNQPAATNQPCAGPVFLNESDDPPLPPPLGPRLPPEHRLRQDAAAWLTRAAWQDGGSTGSAGVFEGF
jgi:hypothetical protein